MNYSEAIKYLIINNNRKKYAKSHLTKISVVV